ncbi:MAG: DUF2304 domain-containing protein [Candidatus Omnitrophica bacterium]|nr:DUF2304 domain-containing protein [Candidatus Omnitrophota bacterium]
MTPQVEIPFRQQIFIIISGLILLSIVVELVRRRKILEQYSAIWILIGILSISFIWMYPFVQWFTSFIGAGMTTSSVLFMAVFFLLLMNLQFSVKITDFSFKLKDAIQEISLLNGELERLKEELKTEKKDSNSAGSESIN